MKKKVLFMAINMNVGGTEKALLNMIMELPKDKFDITLLLLEKQGDFLEQIPDFVKVEVVPEYKQLKMDLNQKIYCTSVRYLKRGSYFKAIKTAAYYVCFKLAKNSLPFLGYITRNIEPLKTECDVAVAYAGPMDFISFFIANKVSAKKKVQWIHLMLQR